MAPLSPPGSAGSPEVRTHPLWRPYQQVDLTTLAAVRVSSDPRPVHVEAPDPGWPAAAAAVLDRVLDALGPRALSVEHVGSTAVPGLAAKAVLDLDLVVADSDDEAAWLPDLEAAGFVLRIREPEWEGHRMLVLFDPAVNLHVWSPGSAEPRRHVLFRDWLRAHPADRDAYAELKTSLAARGFADVMDYNNHKAALVYDLYEKAFAATGLHDSHPRA